MVRALSLKLLLTILLIILAVVPHLTRAEASPWLLQLDYEVMVEETGMVKLVCELDVVNNGSEAAEAPAISLLYHKELKGTIAAYSLSPGSRRLEVYAERDFTELRLVPVEPSVVKPGDEEEVKLILYLKGALKPGEDGYRLKLTVKPGASLPIQILKTSVAVPIQASVEGVVEGFREEVEDGLRVLEARFENVSSPLPETRTLNITAPEGSDFTLVEVKFARRVLEVTPELNLIVKDEFVVENTGLGVLKSVKLGPLNRIAGGVKLKPVGEPPLLAPTTTLILDRLVLREAGLPELRSGEKLRLKVEYPLPHRMVENGFGGVRLTLPPTPPVAGVADRMVVEAVACEGVLLTGVRRVEVFNATEAGGPPLKLSLKPGPAWAAQSALPYATLAFLASALTLLLAEKLKPAAERIPSRLRELLKAYRDKAEAVRFLVERLAELGPHAKKPQLLELRDGFMRHRRFVAEASRQVTPEIFERSEVRRALNAVKDADRELDRSFFTTINFYEQSSEGRVRRGVFDHRAMELRERVLKATSSLEEAVKMLEEALA